MIRVGTVGYLNADPLTWALDRSRYEVVPALPSQIARQLAEGEVDVALVPVAAVLQDPSLAIVPGWCVGADGPVESVVIAAEGPPETWTELRLDGASRTSVTLARLLVKQGPLAARVRPDLQLIDVPPHTAAQAIGGTVAAVVIGDPARELPAHLQRYDLAELWKAWTGLPFVFAVWAARDGLPAEVRADLLQAGHDGLAQIFARTEGADRTYLTERIRHRFDEPALMGLRRFAALAHAAGLVGGHLVRLLDPIPTRVPHPDVDALLTRASEGTGLTDAEALALWTHASLADLGAAADTLRRARHGNVATYAIAAEVGSDADTELLRLSSLDPGPLFAALARLRTSAPRALRLELLLPAGSLVEPGRPSTTTWLRALALLRLALPNLEHLGTSPVTQGLDACQLGLSFGADDLGTVGEIVVDLPVDCERFPATVEEAERLLRAGGWQIVQRDAGFRQVGEAVTPARKVRPVEARAQGSSPTAPATPSNANLPR